MFLPQIPSVQQEQVRNMEVIVQGDTFYSREVRKVMIRAYKPQTFIQSDKPIYLPGQTGNLESSRGEKVEDLEATIKI